mmetsp:Transcript_10827/g.23893  ORF Transcript_10827/g.23893 Transcript_10827/m.23893 type:complete len:203 (+) Transcript_10827:933-1541(+)
MEEWCDLALEPVDPAGSSKLSEGDVAVAAEIEDAEGRSHTAKFIVTPTLEVLEKLAGDRIYLSESNEAGPIPVEGSPSPWHIAMKTNLFTALRELIEVAAIAAVGIQRVAPSLQIALEGPQQERLHLLGRLFVGRGQQEGPWLELVQELEVLLHDHLIAVAVEAVEEKLHVALEAVVVQRVRELSEVDGLRVVPVESLKSSF